jgi:hypothetical protein
MTKISAPSRLRVNNIFRRPSAGCGPSRLSFERGAKRLGEIGSSLRWSDGVCGFEGVL